MCHDSCRYVADMASIPSLGTGSMGVLVGDLSVGVDVCAAAAAGARRVVQRRERKLGRERVPGCLQEADRLLQPPAAAGRALTRTRSSCGGRARFTAARPSRRRRTPTRHRRVSPPGHGRAHRPLSTATQTARKQRASVGPLGMDAIGAALPAARSFLVPSLFSLARRPCFSSSMPFRVAIDLALPLSVQNGAT